MNIKYNTMYMSRKQMILIKLQFKRYDMKYIRSYVALYHTFKQAIDSYIYRPRPIMLKILPIILLSIAQKNCPLCSILCS